MPDMINDVPPHGDQNINALLSNYRWDSSSLTYSFLDSVDDLPYFDYQLESGESAWRQIGSAGAQTFRYWLNQASSFIQLEFTELSGSEDLLADLRVSIDLGSVDSYTGEAGDPEQEGDVFFDESTAALPVPGTRNFLEFGHQLGHLLGLYHGDEDPSSILQMTWHNNLYSIMVVNGLAEEGAMPTTFMQTDIAALQALYGANFAARSGSTVYRWDSGTGELEIDGVGQGHASSTVLMTVWDGGGFDTYDLASGQGNQRIDLRPGGWTVLDTQRIDEVRVDRQALGNIANALLFENDTRSLIENATAGSGNDHLTGNRTVNRLIGGAGHDVLIGLGNQDRLAGQSGNDVLFGDGLPYAPSAIHMGSGVLNDETLPTAPRTEDTTYLGAGIVSLNSLFALHDDPNIEQASSVPHVTITTSVGQASTWQYAVTVHTPGAILTVDVDAWRPDRPIDTRVYLTSASGHPLTSTDDDLASLGGAGSDGDGELYSWDPYLRYQVTEPGIYLIHAEIALNTFGGADVLESETIDIHVSLAADQAPELDGPLIEGADLLDGGQGNDLLVGGGHSDVLDGGLGNDILYGDQWLAAPSGIALGSGLLTISADSQHETLSSALDVSNLFSLGADPHIDASTTIPHVKILGHSDFTEDFYAVTINNPGAVLTLNFDRTSLGLVGHHVGLRLYDANGVLLASNDAAPATVGAQGSNDAYLSHQIARPGTYYFSITKGPTDRPYPPSNPAYELNVSVHGELAVNTGTSQNDGHDILRGGLGDDRLYGGGGNDVLMGDTSPAPWTGQVTINEDDGIHDKPAEIDISIDSDTSTLFIAELYSLALNPNILESTTTPHVTFNATTGTTIDAYWVDVSHAGNVLTFDIDGAQADGSSLDLALRLSYQATDADGHVADTAPEQITVVDDGDSPDFGSTSSLDPYLSYTSTQAGLYIVEVGMLVDGVFTALPPQATYQLHISHAGEADASGNDHLAGGAGDDTLYGQDGDDELLGGDGQDNLFGGDGDDMLNGGQGNDRLEGGLGDDSYLIEYGIDLAVENPNEGRDVLYTTLRGRLPENIEVLFLVYPDEGVIDPAIYNQWVHGNDLDNVIDNSQGTASIRGEGGDDVISGGTEIDYLYGNAGDDVLYGNRGTDVLYGDTGNDTLSGGHDDDILYGDEGDDILDGGTGADSMTGGVGNDRYHVGALQDRVLEDEDSGVDEVISTVDYTLGNHLENLTLSSIPDEHSEAGLPISGTGNALNNIIIGNTIGNQIFGRAGDDRIDGLEGDDDLRGELGDDRLDGGAGSDFLSGDDGNDTLIGGLGRDVLRGEAGADLLQGGSGDDQLIGGEGDDRLEGGAHHDSYGVDSAGDVVVELEGEGTDEVYASVHVRLWDNVEHLTLQNGFLNAQGVRVDPELNAQGNALNNRIHGNDANNQIDGDAGDDLIYGHQGADTLRGGLGDDMVFGDDQADTLYGDAGDDHLDGGTGDDVLIGGTGHDEYALRSELDQITELTDEGTDHVLSAFTYQLAANLENLTLLGGTGLENGVAIDEALAGFGNDLNNRILGNEAGNWIDGNDGDDQLEGRGGHDALSGGAGQDVLLGGDGNDVLVGGAGDDQLAGGAGDDTLVGDVGITHIDSEAAHNVMQGGAGNDVYVVHSINDDIQELASEGVDHVYSSLSWILGDHVEALTLNPGPANAQGDVIDDNLMGMGNTLNNVIEGNQASNWLDGAEGDDVLIGDGGNDALYGRAGNDILYGNNGDDVLDGGEGADLMSGGVGNDQYFVSEAGDQIEETDTGGIDTVRATGNYVLYAHLENLILLGTAVNGSGNPQDNWMQGNDGVNWLGGGAGHDMIFGFGDNDSIYGDEGNDVLYGGDGNDLLDGGTGRDVMHGGAGDDYFVVRDLSDEIYEEAGAGIDTVLTYIDNYVPFANTENIRLGGNALSASGNATDNWMEGNAGDNFLGGGAGQDWVLGLAGNDWLQGDEGDDILDGGQGDDLLYGGTGADTMIGGMGSDSYYVDNLFDHVEELANGGELDKVYAVVNYAMHQHVEAVQVTTDSGAWIQGNTQSNAIAGHTGNDNLHGLDGDDWLEGRAGHDGLYGGPGADRLIGGDGEDWLDGGTGNDRIEGGLGADHYRFGLGSGTDILVDTDSTPDVFDQLTFTNINSDSLWFQRLGYDLAITVNHAGSADEVLIVDWFRSNANKVEAFWDARGHMIERYQADAIVNALAQSGVAAPTPGTAFTTQQQTTLNAIAGQYW